MRAFFFWFMVFVASVTTLHFRLCSTHPEGLAYFLTEVQIIQQAQASVNNQNKMAGDPWPDSDFDGVIDTFDNCPTMANPVQQDRDHNNIGDFCDTKCEVEYPEYEYCEYKAVSASEWWDPYCQNCYHSYPKCSELEPGNPALATGKCDDVDGDGLKDQVDNCPDRINPEQRDTDEDGVGDACDSEDWCGPRPLPCPPPPQEEQKTVAYATAQQPQTNKPLD
ncbi:MAG: thrombospondin type 3 repeat-containing protein [Patescibacteria group bacterium]